MYTRFGWIIFGVMACTNAGTVQDPGAPPTEPAAGSAASSPSPPPPTPAPPESTPPPAPLAMVTVQMTAATLADDCDGPPPANKEKAKSAVKGDRARRACDQSSMQLSVVAAAGSGPTQLSVKQVELFDDRGARIGELSARTPSVWDPSGTYQPWDQSVAPGQELSVSYALSQPPWGDVPDRWNRTYVLKAVITIGGAEQPVERTVHVAAPTSLPPNVKT